MRPKWLRRVERPGIQVHVHIGAAAIDEGELVKAVQSAMARQGRRRDGGTYQPYQR